MSERLPPKLDEIVQKAKKLTDNIYSTFDGKNAYTFSDQVRQAASLTEDRGVKISVNELLHELSQYFSGVGPTPTSNDALVIIDKDDFEARLTLVPPRSGGRTFTLQNLTQDLKASGVIHGLNIAAVNAAWEKLTKKEEMILGLAVARGVPPTGGEGPSIEYLSKIFDKNLIFGENGWSLPDFYSILQHVDAGHTIARILTPAAGQPGISIAGRPVPPPTPRSVPIKLGGNLKYSATGKDLVSGAAGIPVLEETTVDVVPFYLVSGDLTASAGEVSFNGNILVRGNIIGPLTVRAEDIYVEGNVEAASLFATGDIFVRGAIVGKNSGVVECDGRLYAHSISDATVEALDDIVVRNSIVYSDVTSNSKLIVEAGVGVVVGGSVAALKEIVARSIGSDFGTFTKTSVGKDFLTPRRIQKMEDRIKMYEQKLAKIGEMKKKMSEAGINLLNLPPEKQDMFLSVLKHETKTRELMDSLKRTRGKFQRAVEQILSASIKVLEKMHPPVQVQICEAIQEIRERLNTVVLTLGDTGRIVTKSGDSST
ncbi:MAG: FapA family protein [Planctomycetota bacterium]|nr:FapA family protein [Planctomycetota bacterium]